MGNTRRHFLRTISGVAALPAIGSVLITEPCTGLGVASSGDVRAQFPLLGDSMNGHPLVYLDSAATTQRPRAVLDTLETFYLHENANPSMSLHALARHSASLYDEARATVAGFLNARGSDEIVFTRGTTEAINLVASSWGGANLGRGDEILITVSDHYSSLVPWQLAARRTGATLRIWDVNDDGHLRLDQLDALLSRRTKMVTFPHVSNVLGAINPAKEICERAHRAGEWFSSTRRSPFHISAWMSGRSAVISWRFRAQNVRGDGDWRPMGAPRASRCNATVSGGKQYGA